MPSSKKYLRALNISSLLSWFEEIKGNSLLTATKFDSRKYLHSFVVFLFSLYVLCSLHYTDLSNSLLRKCDNLSEVRSLKF